MKKIGHAIWRLLIHSQRFLMALFSALIAVLLFLQALFRYFLDLPLFGIEEAAVYLAIWLYFIGAAYASYGRYYISASLLDLVFDGSQVQKVIELIAMLISLAVLGTMVYWCWLHLAWTAQFNMQSVELKMPIAFLQSIVVVGLALSWFYMLLECIDKASDAVRDKRIFTYSEAKDL